MCTSTDINRQEQLATFARPSAGRPPRHGVLTDLLVHLAASCQTCRLFLASLVRYAQRGSPTSNIREPPRRAEVQQP